MNITNVTVKQYNGNNERVKAVATIELDGAFVVNSLKIVEGNERLFVSMPSYRLNDGNHMNIAHPINQEAREQIESAVIAAYQEANLK